MRMEWTYVRARKQRIVPRALFKVRLLRELHNADRSENPMRESVCDQFACRRNEPIGTEQKEWKGELDRL